MSFIFKISKSFFFFEKIGVKYSNYKNYRNLEKIFKDFKEQDFIKDVKDIYYELIEAVDLNLHFILIRSLDKNIYKVIT